MTRTQNKEPTLEKLLNESFILDIFKVSLLQDNGYPILGVSLNRIVVTGYCDSEKETQVMACVEIKNTH